VISVLLGKQTFTTTRVNLILNMLLLGGIGHQSFCYRNFLFDRMFFIYQKILMLSLILSCPYEKPVDIWAIGCIACELANGRPLFPGTVKFHYRISFLERWTLMDYRTIKIM